jgi:Replication-relaxation
MAKIINLTPGPAGRVPARPAVSAALIARLAGRLTGRDRWLLRMLLEHRVLTTTQIIDLGYGAPRRATMRLGELYRLRAVDRFRPLAATGSAPYHWVLDAAGADVLAAEDALTPAQLGYRRDRALDIAFSPRLAHTTGTNGLFTALAAAARDGGGELACWWSERRCTALWGDLARPDGYGLWRDPDGQSADFFAEYDTGSEDLPRVAAKLTGYRELAARTRIATPVLFWLASGPSRERHLRALLTTSGPVPGVPVATATPASGAGSPAGAAWLPAWETGPPRQLARLTPHQAPAQPPGGDTGLPWHPPIPHPPPGQAFGAARQPPRDTP